jgi:hypothetical protein
LEKDDIESLKSDFLSSLTDPDTNFSKLGDGVYSVDADPESLTGRWQTNLLTREILSCVIKVRVI